MDPTGLISDGEVTSLLVTMARAITSQLNHEDVFKQTLETAMSLTHADETSIWLVDDMTGELFLEAEQGMQDKHIRHARLPVVDRPDDRGRGRGRCDRTGTRPEGDPVTGCVGTEGAGGRRPDPMHGDDPPNRGKSVAGGNAHGEARQEASPKTLGTKGGGQDARYRVGSSGPGMLASRSAGHARSATPRTGPGPPLRTGEPRGRAE